MFQLMSRSLKVKPKAYSLCGVALKMVVPVSLPTDHLTEQDANNERRYTEPRNHVHEGSGHKRPAHDIAEHRHTGLKAPSSGNKHEGSQSTGETPTGAVMRQCRCSE